MAIGGFAYFKTRSLADYLLGGRKMGVLVTALSAGASDMSGWLLLGLPGAIYLSGLQESWIVVGLFIGAFLNWHFVARPLRADTQKFESLTLPDYFEQRFKDKSRILRLISSIIILLFFTFYVASGLVAGAKLFTATFGLTYHVALFAGALVIVGYTAIGGFLAVSWTDVVQGLLMLLALVVVPVIMVLDMSGPEMVILKLRAMDPSYLQFWQGVPALTIVSLLAWGLGYFGQPHILARFMAIYSPGAVSRAKWIGMSWMLVTTLGAVAVGLLGIVYLKANSLVGGDAEKIFIHLTQLIFNPWIAGVLLAAILAAIMSTIDSQLLVSSSSLSEDFYKAWINPLANAKQMVRVGRITVLLVAVVAIAIAYDPDNKVLELVSYAWAGLGASFGPLVLFSLYWQSTTRLAAILGVLVGAGTVLLWSLLEKAQLGEGIFELYELLPAFVFSCLTILLVSWIQNLFTERSESIVIESIE